MDALFAVFVVVAIAGLTSISVALFGSAFERPSLIRLGKAWFLVTWAAMMWVVAAGIFVEGNSRASGSGVRADAIVFGLLGVVALAMATLVAQGSLWSRDWRDLTSNRVREGPSEGRVSTVSQVDQDHSVSGSTSDGPARHRGPRHSGPIRVLGVLISVMYSAGVTGVLGSCAILVFGDNEHASRLLGLSLFGLGAWLFLVGGLLQKRYERTVTHN